MSASPRARAPAWRAVVTIAGCASLGGCLVYDVASAPVKVAVGTAEVAGDVAIGTVKVAGSVAAGGIRMAAGLTRAGMVTFVDTASNNVTRVPYRQGLTLVGASEAAKVQLAQHAVDVVREGKIVYAVANGAGKNTSVAAGDVVQIGR